MENLRAARDRLAGSQAVTVLASSSAYETEPQAGAVGQRDFVNACVAIETALEPQDVLDLAKRIELSLGRAAGGARHAPRPIDIDVLLLGELELRSERLTLPHPDIALRRFVLAPLLELDPALALPDGTSLAQLEGRLVGQRVERLGAL